MYSFLRKIGIALAVFSFSAGATATTLDAGYWEVWENVAPYPSKGARTFWGPNPAAITPTVPAQGQFSQSGGRVVLKPNTNLCSDNLGNPPADIDYWCYRAGLAGAGNTGHWLVASSFDHTNVPVGPASTIDFQGCIVSNTLKDHTFTAFVKVFNSDYSAMWYEQYDGSGSFNLPATLAGDAEANVQVGFTVSGPTVHPDDIDDYGSVVVDLGGACVVAPTPEADPNAIPVLPIGGLFGLIGLVGWLGLRRHYL